MVKRILPLFIATALAACASAPGAYPSLAVRDAERLTGTLQPPAPYVAPPPTPETMADVETLVEQAHDAFESYRGKLDSVRAAALAARGAEVGSEQWARVNLAMAELETERSRTMVPLSEIDQLYVTAATEGGALQNLADAQGLVGEMVDFETAKIDEIWNALR